MTTCTCATLLDGCKCGAFRRESEKKDPSSAKLAELEALFENLPDSARGSGGVAVIENDNIVIKKFETKQELADIIAKIKEGSIRL